MASRGKDSQGRPGIDYRVMGSNLAPEISMRPDTVPGLLADPGLGQANPAPERPHDDRCDLGSPL